MSNDSPQKLRVTGSCSTLVASIRLSTLILCIDLVLLAFAAFVPYGLYLINVNMRLAVILYCILPTITGLAMCILAFAIDKRATFELEPHGHRLLLIPSALATLWGLFTSLRAYTVYQERSLLARAAIDQAERDIWAVNLLIEQQYIVYGIILFFTGLFLLLYSRMSE